MSKNQLLILKGRSRFPINRTLQLLVYFVPLKSIEESSYSWDFPTEAKNIGGFWGC